MARRWNTRNKNFQLVGEHEQMCCVTSWGRVTSCEFDEKRATKPKFVAQSRPALYFSQLLSSTPTSWSRKVKNAKHRPKTCNETMLRDNWGFVNLVFRVPYQTLDDSNLSVARWPFSFPSGHFVYKSTFDDSNLISESVMNQSSPESSIDLDLL